MSLDNHFKYNRYLPVYVYLQNKNILVYCTVNGSMYQTAAERRCASGEHVRGEDLHRCVVLVGAHAHPHAVLDRVLGAASRAPLLSCALRAPLYPCPERERARGGEPQAQ